jgi:hypothetical protein
MSVQPSSASRTQPSIPKHTAPVAPQAHHHEEIETATYYPLNEKSPQWLTVTAEHGGRQVQGLYALDGQILIASYGIHSKTTQLGGMSAPTLARVLLLELAKEGKPLYEATTEPAASLPREQAACEMTTNGQTRIRAP